MTNYPGNADMALVGLDEGCIPIPFSQELQNQQGNGSLSSGGNGSGSLTTPHTNQVGDAESGERHKETVEATPELDIDTHMVSIGKRLVDMGLLREDGTKSSEANCSLREAELLNMVLSLIQAPRISPSQLADQAATISNMQARHEYVLTQMEEERERWDSERSGWERMGEALIKDRTKSALAVPVNEALEKKCLTLEAENQNLKERLYDTHSRLLLLDGEIMKLKPLLITLSLASGMKQPPENLPAIAPKIPPGRSKKAKESTSIQEESTKTIPTPQLRPAFPESQQASIPERQRHTTYSFPSYTYPFMPKYSNSDPSKSANPYLSYSLLHGTPTAQVAYQTSTPATTSVNPSPSSTTPPNIGLYMPLIDPATTVTRPRTSQVWTADAKIEHLLLAARKIGRHRAAYLAGLVNQDVQSQREGYAPPQTKHSGGLPGPSSSQRTNLVTGSSSGLRRTNSQQSGSCVLSPPDGGRASRSSLKSGQMQGLQEALLPPSTPRQQYHQPHTGQTPLDSLVNAALREERQDKTSASTGPSLSRPVAGRRRKVSETEQPEAPAGKRKKTNPTKAGSASKGPGAVQSALDVLADQAQAATPFSGRQPSTSTKAPVNQDSSDKSISSKRKGKGKGFGKESGAQEESKEVQQGEVGEMVADRSSTKLTRGGKPSKSKKATTTPKQTLNQAMSNSKAAPKRPRPPPRDRTLPASSVPSSGPGTKVKVRGQGNPGAQPLDTVKVAVIPDGAEATALTTTTSVNEGPRIIQLGPSETAANIPEMRDVLDGPPAGDLAEISESRGRGSSGRDVHHEERIDKVSSSARNVIDLDDTNLIANPAAANSISIDQSQDREHDSSSRSSDTMSTTAKPHIDLQDGDLVAGSAFPDDVMMVDAAGPSPMSPPVHSSFPSPGKPFMIISALNSLNEEEKTGSINRPADPSVIARAPPVVGAEIVQATSSTGATMLGTFGHQEFNAAILSVDLSDNPSTSEDQEDLAMNDNTGAADKLGSRHDSDLDAEAEDDDGYMDADGEEEGSWPHTACSSTLVANPLDDIPPAEEEDVDADAEGEMEDESDGPPEAIFRPSELVSGTG